MFDSKVDSLLDVPMLDFLVDDHPNRTLGDIVDDASLSVIHLVWHAKASQYRIISSRHGLFARGKLEGY